MRNKTETSMPTLAIGGVVAAQPPSREKVQQLPTADSLLRLARDLDKIPAGQHDSVVISAALALQKCATMRHVTIEKFAADSWLHTGRRGD